MQEQCAFTYFKSGGTRDLFVADNSQMVLKVQVLRNQECIDKNECDWKLFSEFAALR